MRRSLFVFLTTLACATVLVGAALASGPVFVVVPNAPTDSAPETANPLVAQHRQALRRQQRLAQRRAAEAAREERLAGSAQLLSTQLEATQRAVQLQVAAQAAAGRADDLAAQLEELTAPPPVAPVFAPSLGGGPTPGADAVAIAEQFLGVPYRWGGADPTGFDCSGLVLYAYAQLGVDLPHYAASQFESGTPVDVSQLQPGDLVFFEPRSDGPGHVALFVGGDEIIEAPHTGDVVKFASLSNTAAALGFVGAVRPPQPLY